LIHSAHGYWIDEAGPPAPTPPLSGDLDVDVAIVGGGFTGMWTAWHLSGAEPDLRIALVESHRIGCGPSGRNGGFVDSMWVTFEKMKQRYGLPGALRLARASEDSVRQIGEFCEEQGVDAWYRRAGYLNVSTSPTQDGIGVANARAVSEAGVEGEVSILDPGRVAEVCDSPRFRGGVFYESAATVQPARLGFGIRAALLDRGVRLFESSPVTRVEDGPDRVVVRTGGGRVIADQVVLASGPALAGRGSPIRNSVTIASSHMVITEPVPEVIDEIGWTGGEAISDFRSLLAYFRTTPDGRIAFGWGGGRIAAGGRRFGRAEIDPEVVEQVQVSLREYFPGLAGKRIEHAWGGPIDASATHLPHVVRLSSGRGYTAFGYTGNGVGPSQMVGRCIASSLLGRQDEYSSLPIIEPASALTRVPPEPFRWIGGTIIREAIGRKEQAESQGRSAGALVSAFAAVPELIGFHIGR
jgi:glycine/D-amino acid oxidase-like deaminating enzyme